MFVKAEARRCFLFPDLKKMHLPSWGRCEHIIHDPNVSKNEWFIFFRYLPKYALQNANYTGFWLLPHSFIFNFPYFSVLFQIFVYFPLPLVSSLKSLFMQVKLVKLQSFLQAFDIKSSLLSALQFDINWYSSQAHSHSKLLYWTSFSQSLSISTQYPYIWDLEVSYNHSFSMDFYFLTTPTDTPIYMISICFWMSAGVDSSHINATVLHFFRCLSEFIRAVWIIPVISITHFLFSYLSIYLFIWVFFRGNWIF